MNTQRIGTWQELQHDATAIRHEVFVQEQQVPEHIEMDAFDVDCIHAVIYVQGNSAATGRLLPNAHIGRMAVKAAYRGQGLGAQVLLALIDQAKQRGHATVYLSAQWHALPFYEKYGFKAYGEVYLDAGIDHRMMRLDI